MVQTSTAETPAKTRTGESLGSESAAVTPGSTKTKRQLLQERLAAPNGVSLQQLSTEFGWQPHTVRAAISGLRRTGHDVQRETVEGASIYRIGTVEQG